MREKNSNKNNNLLFCIIACIWLFFSCILVIQAFNTWKIYDALATNWTIQWENNKKAIKIQNTREANKAVQKQEYEKALQFISGNTSEDYYNRATIQTLLAYKTALGKDISWLQNAQILIAQAWKNLEIAERLSPSTATKHAIIANQSASTSLSTVVDIKTCYGIGQGIIVNIQGIITTINNIRDMLDQEDIYLNKRAASLGATCYDKLQNIVDTSKEQVGMLQLQMQKNNTQYASDFRDKIDNPTICIQTPYQNIIPSLLKGKEWLELFEQQQAYAIEALKNNDKKSIKELCNQSKNDSQINQQIENSVQELLQKLEDNTTETQQQKRSTNQAEYKDFFNEDEKKTLQKIQETNKWWIDTMLEIRGKWNYTPEKYINDMFNQFYGNSWDFINLHK